MKLLKELIEGTKKKGIPSNAEVEKFFNYYPDVKNAEDFGALYNEEFSDRFSDEEVDKQVLDEYLNRAWYWYKKQKWPSKDWKWYKGK